jgi:hypothetical protein
MQRSICAHPSASGVSCLLHVNQTHKTPPAHQRAPASAQLLNQGRPCTYLTFPQSRCSSWQQIPGSFSCRFGAWLTVLASTLESRRTLSIRTLTFLLRRAGREDTANRPLMPSQKASLRGGDMHARTLAASDAAKQHRKLISCGGPTAWRCLLGCCEEAGVGAGGLRGF